MNIGRDEINTLAKSKINLDAMIITVVGDKKLIYNGLSKLGYEIVELDADGKIIGDKNNPPIYPEKKN